MALTKEQKVLLASFGALAVLDTETTGLYPEVELAAIGKTPGAQGPGLGDTIASGAPAPSAGSTAGAAPGALGSVGHGGGQAHVKTALGVAKYKVPLGALIVPHPHVVPHGTPKPSPKPNVGVSMPHGKPAPPGYDTGPHGEPSESPAEEAYDVAEAAKDAQEKAAKAIHGGTHHTVQAGQHSFAVHNGLEVHVPKDTDLHDEAAVKNAPKVVVKHGDAGSPDEHVMLHPQTGMGQVFEHHDIHAKGLAEGYKKLPDQPPVKSVHIKGKHAAFVPHDWQVHKAAGKPDDQIPGKFAKDPEGHWHFIDASGVKEKQALNAAHLEAWKQKGHIVPDEDVPPPAPDHIAPAHGVPGPESGKVDVGGIAVTKDEIHSAIALLNAAKSTNVKGPLKSKGHPLAAMDYMGISAAELKQFPELKVEKGSKKAHVGQVKLAVLHHLAAKLGDSAQTEAEEKVHEEVKTEVKVAAQHAQVLTPKALAWGGQEANKDQLQQAMDWLVATMGGHGSFKQAMQKAGNPLAGADYMKAAKDYKLAHPNTAKGLSTKALMLESLKALQGQAAKADVETGHDAAAELHQTLTHGFMKKGWDGSQDGAMAAALLSAASAPGKKGFAFPAPGEPGKWDMSAVVHPFEGEADKVWFEATSDHQLILHDDAFPAGVHESPEKIAQVVKDWVTDHKPEPDKPKPEPKKPVFPPVTVLPEKPKPEPPPIPDPAPEPKPADVLAAFKKDPAWKKIHSALLLTPVKNVPDASVTGTDASIARLLWLTSKLGADRWRVVSAPGEPWTVVKSPPEKGSWGAQTGAGFFHVTKDHQVIHVLSDGEQVDWSPGAVQSLITKHLAAKEPEKPKAPEPVKPTLKFEPLVQELAGIHGTVLVPPGSTTWQDIHAPNYGTYVKLPGGGWDFAHESNMHPAKPMGENLSLDSWIENGNLKPLSESAKAFAAKAGAVKAEVQPEEALKPTDFENFDAWKAAKDKTAEDISVTIGGTEVAKVPAGSKVYSYVHGGTTAVTAKYVKLPDGTWKVVHKNGSVSPGLASGYNGYIGNGFDEDTAEPKFTYKAPEPKAEAKAPEPVAPPATDAPLPILSPKGKLLKETAPPGSKFYEFQQSYGGGKQLFIHKPDGGWMQASEWSATNTTAGTLGEKLAKGLLAEVPPPGPEQLAQAELVTKVKAVLKTGAVDPAKVPNSGAATWEAAVADALTGFSTEGTITVNKKDDGKFTSKSTSYPTGETFTINFDTLTGIHHPLTGADEPITFAQVKALIDQHVVPNSVVVAKQLHKYGFYYNPKGKAFLEVKAASGSSYGYHATYQYGSAASGTYIYHAVNGSTKQVSPTKAEELLEKNTEFHEQTKEFEFKTGSVKKANFATAVKPGTFFMWSSTEPGGLSKATALEFMGDDSAVYTTPGLSDTPLTPEAVNALLTGGGVLDQFGNTVVKPGLMPAAFHLFHGPAKSLDELKALLKDLEQQVQPGMGWQKPFIDFVGGDLKKVAPGLQPFLNEKNTQGNGEGQRQSLMALLRELTMIPTLPSGTDLAGNVEAKFLKGLPPGINTPKDVFTWTDSGFAHPFTGDLGTSVLGMDSPQLAEKVKAISSQFGEGKVIGTHVASLSKTQRLQWLTAFKKGDMATVFNLDASSGKVSSVHPGAPDNQATHLIHWSAWDPSQVPASKDIDGAWTPADITPPKAEVDNFLIKVGVQHAAFLTLAERRSLVKAHRLHDQETVDAISRTASERFNNGEQPLSAPPVWTANVQPAKSFDVFLEDGKPASSWTYKAREDFIAAHKDELLPFAQQLSETSQWSGYTAQQLLNETPAQVVQAFLDDKAAKELAEQLRPKFELVPGKPGTAQDQFGHTFHWHTGTDKELANRVAASTLARAWGFKTPTTQLVKLETDGTPGTVTAIIASAGTMASLPGGIGSALEPRELADVAREHVFDFAIGNPSSTLASYLRMPDGSIVGVGKDAAFSDLGWDGGDAQVTQPVSLLFQAIASGNLAKDAADAAYIAAQRVAVRMSSLSASRLAEILDASGLSTKDKTLLAQRIENLPAEVKKLWDAAFAKAGWEPPAVPIAKLPHGLHSGFNEPEFFDHVMAAKSFGAPAFFAGPHLEDASFLVWTEVAGKNRFIRGESSLRGPALDKAVAWAKSKAGLADPSTPTVDTSGGVKKNAAWFKAVLGGAKAVSMHAGDQNFEGSWTKQQLANLAELKTELKQTIQLAESVQGPEVSWAGFKAENGPPDKVKAAAQFYLNQVEQVEKAKAAGTAFKPGDMVAWEAPEVAAAPKVETPVKVEYLKATRVLTAGQDNSSESVTGDIFGPDGELHLGKGIYEYPGFAYHITLPTGELIEINDKESTSSPKGHFGRVRFRAIASEGSASLERIRAQLQVMGVPMEEATPVDMELFYFRHLAYILADRTDRTEGKHAKVWQALQTGVPAAAKHSGGTAASSTQIVDTVIAADLAPEAELEVWHKAFGNLTTEDQLKQFSNDNGFLPHLGHFDITAPDVPGGKPKWFRFDADAKKIASLQLPKLSLSGGASDVKLIVGTGGLFSTEARLRAEGIWKTGMSSTSDMTSYGSSGYVYTRLNQETNAISGNVLVSPRALAQTSTYGFNGDKNGDINQRKTSAYFNIDKASKHSVSNNETNVKDGISLLDDVMVLVVGSETERQKDIAILKARGITHIRGLAVEDRIVTSVTPSTLAKVKAAEPDPAAWFAHPAEAWTPPVSAVVSKEQSAVQTEAEKAASHASVQAEHTAGAPIEKVHQLFYHQPTEPSQNTIHEGKMQVKIDTGKRVAENMKSSDEQIVALADAAHINVPAAWGPTRQATVGAFIQVWALTNNSVIAHAFQQVAHDLFGIVKDQSIVLSADMQNAVNELISLHGATIRDFLQTQWNLTQQDLKEAGIENLTLFRGFSWGSGSGPWGTPLFGKGKPDWANVGKGAHIQTPPSKAFSSWAFKFDKNSNAFAEFAGHGGSFTIVKTTIPASLIMSFPRSGMGSFWQAEFIVLDSPGEWEIIDVG